MQQKTQVLIVGAGVIGLAIGREILLKNPKAEVLIIDKEDTPGKHASSLNSGVVHAGIYYDPRTLKAKLSSNGNRLMRNFIQEHEVPWVNSGKVIVARDQQELRSLEIIYSRGIENGVELHLVNKDELSNIEPLAATYQHALWSPTTAVADPRALLQSLVKEYQRLGGKLLLGVELLDTDQTLVKTSIGEIHFAHLINASGVYADKIARKFGFSREHEMLPFAGIYFDAPNLKNMLKTHIYPTPDFEYPFLGVHFTKGADGSVKLGPSAIPLLGREQYSFNSRVKFDETSQIIRGLIKFGLNSENNWKSFAKSELRHLFTKFVSDEGKALLRPGLDLGKIHRKPRIGIRAQLISARSGILEMDFVLEGDETSTHILNAVSPGWTCCFSMAQHIVKILQNKNIV